MSTTIDNDGVGLALAVEGNGPDLLFVHGLGSAQVLWHPLIAALSDRYRCWNLDLRGHGASDRAPGNYTPAAYASDVAAALDHIGRPTVGIGHSLGGGSLARTGAAEHTHLSAAYLLDSTIFPPPGGRTASAAIFERQLAMLREFQPQNRPVDDYEERLAAAPTPAGSTNADVMVPSQLRGRAESLSQLDPECIESILAGRLLADHVLPALHIPLRVIAADPDLGASFRPEHAARLRELTPHAEIETTTGVGHQLMMMRGFDEQIRLDLVDFLARVT